jgi:phosphoribosylaminoimidazole-succinocarboxamide synthase
MEKGDLLSLIPGCLGEISLPPGGPGTRIGRGKVRDIVDLGRELLIVTTDRISAFDRVLTTIPCKGEVLNTISLFWFKKTSDLISNHIVEELSARTVRTLKCSVVPVEVVVRGYLTGSAWRDYRDGKPVSGITLPQGMRPNQRFDTPLLTPSTKEEKGSHDKPISSSEILSGGIVPQKTWHAIEEASLALYKRGAEVAAANGLILVDTKYEFGERDGKLFLIDEIHTPDSSRYWYADAYEELFARGENQRELDKEYLRRWLLERNWKGDGVPPEIPAEIRVEVAWRYITAWQTITGSLFSPRALGQEEESALVSKAMAAMTDRGGRRA